MSNLDVIFTNLPDEFSDSMLLQELQKNGFTHLDLHQAKRIASSKFGVIAFNCWSKNKLPAPRPTRKPMTR